MWCRSRSKLGDGKGGDKAGLGGRTTDVSLQIPQRKSEAQAANGSYVTLEFRSSLATNYTCMYHNLSYAKQVTQSVKSFFHFALWCDHIRAHLAQCYAGERIALILAPQFLGRCSKTWLSMRMTGGAIRIASSLKRQSRKERLVTISLLNKYTKAAATKPSKKYYHFCCEEESPCARHDYAYFDCSPELRAWRSRPQSSRDSINTWK